MKKLVTILLLMVLISCGSSPSRTIPTSNTDYEKIIGIPIKISNIEVAQYSFPFRMNWDYANKACAQLGDGWRLPTKDESYTLYQNKDKIRRFFVNDVYWTSTENSEEIAWFQSFDNGGQFYNGKNAKYYVRAIRTF